MLGLCILPWYHSANRLENVFLSAFSGLVVFDPVEKPKYVVWVIVYDLKLIMLRCTEHTYGHGTLQFGVPFSIRAYALEAHWF